MEINEIKIREAIEIINKIDTPLTNWEKRGEDLSYPYQEWEKWHYYRFIDIQTIGEYYKQFMPIKCDKLNEMDILLHNIYYYYTWKTQMIKFAQEKSDNLNSPISIKQIEVVFKNIATKKNLEGWPSGSGS